MPFFGIDQCVHMNVDFHFPVNGMDEARWQRSLAAKGDIDNFAKFVQDALQGHFYANDKQIVSLNARKIGHPGLRVGRVEVELLGIAVPVEPLHGYLNRERNH